MLSRINVVSQTDIRQTTIESGALTSNGYIRADSSGTWKVISVDVVYAKQCRITGNFSNLSSSYLHIAFYKGKTPSQDNFISGILLPSSNISLRDEYYDLPTNTQKIVVMVATTNVSSVEIATDESKIFTPIVDSIEPHTVIQANGWLQAHSGSYNTSSFFKVGNASNILFSTDRLGLGEGWTDVGFFDNYGNLIQKENGKYSIFNIPYGTQYVRYTTGSTSDTHYLLDQNAAVNDFDLNYTYDNLLLNYGDFSYDFLDVNFRKSQDTVYITGSYEEDHPVMCKILPLELIQPGKKYRIYFEADSNIYLQFIYDLDNATTLRSGDVITIPDTSFDCYVRIIVNYLTTSTINKQVKISILRYQENSEVINQSNVSQFDKALETTKLVLLGDSVTQGAGASGLYGTEHFVTSFRDTIIYTEGNSWAIKLAAYLQTEYPNITLINHGQGGLNIATLARYIDEYIPMDTTDVILGIGINSQGDTSFDAGIETIVNYLVARGIKVYAWTNWLGYHYDKPNINTAGRTQAALVHAYNRVGITPLPVVSIAQEYLDEHDLTLDDVCERGSTAIVHPNDLGHEILYRIIRKGFGF